MSLFLVMYIHFSCNINKWLSLNTVSLNIFDRVPVAQKWPVGTQRSTTGGPKVARWQTGVKKSETIFLKMITSV